jgi:DNA/RNA endonuclease YhcR with UshA esterase domain
MRSGIPTLTPWNGSLESAFLTTAPMRATAAARRKAWDHRATTNEPDSHMQSRIITTTPALEANVTVWRQQGLPAFGVLQEARGMNRRVASLLVVGTLALAACSSTTAQQAPPEENGSRSGCENAVSWSDASAHIGEMTRVEGPVVGATFASSSNGQPTFLNLGRDYPDPGRFTVVIWGESRASFSTPPEDAYRGKTICVTGEIESYQGVPQVVVSSPSQIESPG